MKLSEATYRTCGECGVRHEQLTNDVYGCDHCRKPISMYVNGKTHHDFLALRVFHQGSGTEEYQFCSWECVFRYLPKIKGDYFVDLPFIHYEDDTVKGQHAKDLMKLVRKALK